MLRPVLAAAVLAATATLPAVPARAAACAARADAPQPVDAMVLASGAFLCATPESGMTVTVCVESLSPLGSLGWTTENCTTDTAPGSVSSVEGSTAACVLRTPPVLVRTAVSGSNAAGDSAHATSAPVWAPGFGSCGP